MSLVPSSSSCLNNASLAGSYLSLMFCAFPKPLSKGSGLSLRVTSNDNLFVVICVQTTRDIQNSNTAFLKKSKSIKKLSYVKQVLLSKNKKKKNVKEKLALPAPQFNMQNSWPVPSHQQDGLMQVHISKPSTVLNSVTLLSGDKRQDGSCKRAVVCKQDRIPDIFRMV